MTEKTLVNQFEARVIQAPGATAVEDKNTSFTYDRINRWANQVARAIEAHPAPKQAPVAFLLEHGVAQIVAIMALLKAGRIAVALDPAYPLAQLRAMLADSGAELVIMSRETISLKDELGKELASFNVNNIETFDDRNLEHQIEGTRLASIYYTSGTTGAPKGVMQTHENVLRFVLEMGEDWTVINTDRFIQTISCSFSAALLPILVPLLHGAAVIPFDLRREGVTQLAGQLIDQNISVLFCVPSVFRGLSNSPPDTQEPGNLRLCVFTGEPLHTDDVAHLRRIFGPKCSARNLLGSSETHQVASLRIEHESDVGNGTVSAGRIADSKEVLLVDDQDDAVPDGEIGEILVRSRYLSPGYWRRPKLTSEAFIEPSDLSGIRAYRSGDLGRMRADGLLELVGRNDSRVKLRGQMVETAAIEAALTAEPLINEAVVSMRTNLTGGDQLIAWVTIQDGKVLSLSELELKLTSTLPRFMVPSRFVILPALPRTASAKIDRAALPDPERGRPGLNSEMTLPRNAEERIITRAVEQVLGTNPVGVKDDLFDLGLGSLSYVELHMELESQLGRTLPEDVFVYARTVEQLATPGLETAGSEHARQVEGGGQEYGRSWRRLKIELVARFWIAKVLGRIVPYDAAVAGLIWLCKRSLVQHMWPVRRRVRMAREMLATIDTVADEHDVIAHNLACNFFQPWLLGTIPRMSDKRLEERLDIVGMHHFDVAVEQGHGVILAVSHFGLPHLDLLALHRAGREGIVTLGAFPYELRLLGLEKSPHVPLRVEPVQNFLFRTRFLYRARTVLQKGGVVRIAADGLHGTSGQRLRFHRRYRHFRGGFAELAFSTGAKVVPVFSEFKPDGRLHVEFMPCLDSPLPMDSRQVCVNRLVKQYARILEQRWALDPSNVVWEIAQAHLAAPTVS